MYIIFQKSIKRVFFVLDSVDQFLICMVLSFWTCDTYFSRQEKKHKNLAQSSKKDGKNSSYRGGSDEIALTIKISLRELIRLRCHAMFFKFFQKLPKPIQDLLTGLINF
jgi:hypothetical protein